MAAYRSPSLPDVWQCMFFRCRPAIEKVRHGERGNHVPGLTTVTVSTLEEVRVRFTMVVDDAVAVAVCCLACVAMPHYS